MVLHFSHAASSVVIDGRRRVVGGGRVLRSRRPARGPSGRDHRRVARRRRRAREDICERGRDGRRELLQEQRQG